MLCQWHIGECKEQATQVADVPFVGESVCFCDKHAAEGGGSDWYPLTPERADQEEKVEECNRMTWKSIMSQRSE